MGMCCCGQGTEQEQEQEYQQLCRQENGFFLCWWLLQQTNTHKHTYFVGLNASSWQGRFLCTRRSPHKASRVLPPSGTGMGVQTLLLLITTRHIQAKAVVQSACLWQKQSPWIRRALQGSFLGPVLCSCHCQLNSGVHTKIFTLPKVPRHTSGNSDWENEF